VNGRARISIDPNLLQRFSMQDKLPKCVLEISVDTVFFQCARAIQRSKLWEFQTENDHKSVPTAGAIVEALTDHAIDSATYDKELPARQKSSLY
jgi:predicted pyridoxine 5'-phosphate oxidase superfamily flavin-nucleotide-binding protein